MATLRKGWYWQSDTVPDMDEAARPARQMVEVFRREGIEVHFLDGQGQTDGMLKAVYTRDSALMVKGGAVVCRMAPRIRQGEENGGQPHACQAGRADPAHHPFQPACWRGARLRGSTQRPPWSDRSIRINDEAIEQLDDVLKRQGVELLVVDLNGYTIHIDGSFVMVDKDLALVDATQLPYWFLEKLRALGVDTVEITPQDNPWIINGLAIAPGRYMMGNGASNRTLDLLQSKGVEVIPLDFDLVQLNGGGIHCSTMPLIRRAFDSFVAQFDRKPVPTFRIALGFSPRNLTGNRFPLSGLRLVFRRAI